MNSINAMNVAKKELYKKLRELDLGSQVKEILNQLDDMTNTQEDCLQMLMFNVQN